MYYTIRFSANGKERQTTGEKLSRPEQPLPHIANGLDEVSSYILELPPTLHVAADSEVNKKIKHYLQMKAENGFNLAENIRTHKDFGNPKVM